jgi:hypothetical protein
VTVNATRPDPDQGSVEAQVARIIEHRKPGIWRSRRHHQGSSSLGSRAREVRPSWWVATQV